MADAVAALVAGFDRPPARRALDSAQHRARHERSLPTTPTPRIEGPADAAAALEARAVTITDRPQPTRLVELDDAVVAAVRIGDALGTPIPVPPLASGAVALRRAAAAPTPDQGRHRRATACTRRMPRGRSATDRSSSAPPTS